MLSIIVTQYGYSQNSAKTKSNSYPTSTYKHIMLSFNWVYSGLVQIFVQIVRDKNSFCYFPDFGERPIIIPL